ncbi:BQ5605_C008g05221 [Microbotryum silenes-dioicae]|uniref:BQ5605_C008g05221 protein n=1 Tax=Microbotryum silenes-dioicae TaxID=796604 RepID=A0A2X0MH54_9BASI|nr:BQ5605_C008g05221 [Microbotryum silenes-dioicae]
MLGFILGKKREVWCGVGEMRQEAEKRVWEEEGQRQRKLPKGARPHSGSSSKASQSPAWATAPRICSDLVHAASDSLRPPSPVSNLELYRHRGNFPTGRSISLARSPCNHFGPDRL